MEIKIEGELKIGEFTILDKDYVQQTWIYKDDGEGMVMGQETLEKFHKVIADFYKEHL